MGMLNYVAIVALAAVGAVYLRAWMQPKVPKDVKGFCTPRFSKVKDAFRQNLESGAERGGAFAVYHEGQLVCDLWGGFADESIEYPWREETLSIFFSATKAVCAFCLMLLADRGLLDYEKPVATYWPEFAQNDKENVTVKMLVSHQAGLVGTNESYSLHLLKSNPDEIGRLLAAQQPLWPPGKAMGYHALTYGLYVDQLVRRVDTKHRSIDQFFQEEIALPFDVDFFIGLPKQEHYRLARFMDYTQLGVLVYGFLHSNSRTALMTVMSDPVAKLAMHVEDAVKITRYVHSWPEYREIPHGSIYGHGTARGLAKLYGILANGGKLRNKVLLSETTLPKLNEVVSAGVDQVLGLEMLRGYGTIITKRGMVQPQTTFGHSGYGGQMGSGDTSLKLGWAYLTNYPSPGLGDDATQYLSLRDAMYASLTKL